MRALSVGCSGGQEGKWPFLSGERGKASLAVVLRDELSLKEGRMFWKKCEPKPKGSGNSE